MLLTTRSAHHHEHLLRATRTGRVNPIVVAAQREAMRSADAYGAPAASARLAEAWNHAYGLKPEPSDAVADAIAAVEAVAIPVVMPKQHEPQLWKVLGQLKGQPDPWKLALVGKGGDDSIAPLVAMLERLAGSHLDRHEGGASSGPVTLESARAAVHLAATLVQWFASGAVQRRD